MAKRVDWRQAARATDASRRKKKRRRRSRRKKWRRRKVREGKKGDSHAIGIRMMGDGGKRKFIRNICK